MKTKVLIVLFLFRLQLSADEGMWMPQLIEALNIQDMKKNGFRLTAKQIYDINKASMKDAVAIFGGGCTAEMISGEGLLLTNHHCGYGAIAGLSTVENDLLTKGFFAMDRSQEKPCKGLKVTFIKRIEDVTAKVMANTSGISSERLHDSIVKANIEGVERAATNGTHYSAFVRPFYYGNEYYLFVTEVFPDVRLVGAPPEDIGKFGGETDNWVWPRHNADFSMFRIYADANNKPADFSESNVPYKPLSSFPISLKGVQEGDFTMVYGFPGRTQEYLTSYAVKLIVEQQDPLRVDLRGKRLAIMDAAMKKNDTIRLMYASRYASVANYYKKWRGEMMGLIKSDAVKVKERFEQDFLASVAQDKPRHDKYSELLREFSRAYQEYAPLSRQYDYYTECLLGVDGLRMAVSFTRLFDELRKKQSGKTNRFAELSKTTIPSVPFRNYDKETDRRLCKSMLAVYAKDVERELMPAHLDSLLTVFRNNTDSLTEYIFNTSILIDEKRVEPVYADFEGNSATIQNDPLYRLASAISRHYQQAVVPQVQYQERQINDLQKEYMAALRGTFKNKKFYPDANGTLRVAYGKAEGYNGPDAVRYLHYTTLDGLVEKHLTGVEDYSVPPRVLELHAKKDYGRYADKDGRLRTAFIASNHTTGGNSGSPVINSRGQLIGTNFDRNWEGTMSDIMYNVNFCRNITVDIRFTLWIVDKYAGAGYLLNEMKIVK